MGKSPEGRCPSLVMNTQQVRCARLLWGGGPSGDAGLELLGSSGEREAEADNPENKKPHLACPLTLATIKHALGSCSENHPRRHPSEPSDLGLE